MAIIRRPALIFRRALRRAIWRGWRNGHINGSDAYLLYDIVQGSQRGGRYYMNPIMSRIEDRCREELLAYDPESATTGDIDWSHWIDLIVTWLPIIIKIALLFLQYDKPPADEPSESSKVSPLFFGD